MIPAPLRVGVDVLYGVVLNAFGYNSDSTGRQKLDSFVLLKKLQRNIRLSEGTETNPVINMYLYAEIVCTVPKLQFHCVYNKEGWMI
jgi:hypothetical protein